MACETERKYLTNHLLASALHNCKGTYIKQGYILAEPAKTIRIRIYNEQAFITIKGETIGFTRPEFEYEIPKNDALEMLQLFAQKLIEKTRYRIAHCGFTWEVDVFHGQNSGLIIAEIELPSENTEFSLPLWIAAEVTGDKRYYNSYLAEKPFSQWK
jgi:CYTH domain-containing protein